MFETYLKYCDTLYKPVMENTVEYEKDKMIKRLNSKKSPCLNEEDPPLWFSTLSCPQVVADTYQRPVIILNYVGNMLKTGKIRINHEPQVFFPLIHMDLRNAEHPITILLAHNHFYYVEFKRTPTGRLKKFIKPVLNMDHERLFRSNPDICKENYSVLYYSRK
ncbi:hypothetical protein EDC94DRAFT_275590 [Helicostylum pulchrum]|nr:hypothetical protein EDC94DRAFT_275590 [Helicostylum pulchrum]